jgi:hypothetical protein
MFCPPDYPRQISSKANGPGSAKVVDPQYGWMMHNMNICKFLESVPDRQKLRIRGEDLLSDPNIHLRKIAEWLQISTDKRAIESMKHPERWPYAFLGPRGARLGSSESFLQSPGMRLQQPFYSLEGPLEWRGDGEGFSPEVKELAKEFGYT